MITKAFETEFEEWGTALDLAREWARKHGYKIVRYMGDEVFCVTVTLAPVA